MAAGYLFLINISTGCFCLLVNIYRRFFTFSHALPQCFKYLLFRAIIARIYADIIIAERTDENEMLFQLFVFHVNYNPDL